MFKIVYLPTADEVKISESLCPSPRSKESLLKVIRDYHAYNPGKSFFFLMGTPNSLKVKAHRIPKHLLEVIEVDYV